MRRADPFKGIHRVRYQPKSGKEIVYCYAWRGGPLIAAEDGMPLIEGTREFARIFLDLKAADKNQPPSGTLRDLLVEYRASSAFTKLSGHAKRNYGAALKKIEAKFGMMRLAALRSPSVRGTFIPAGKILRLAP